MVRAQTLEQTFKPMPPFMLNQNFVIKIFTLFTAAATSAIPVEIHNTPYERL